MTVCSGNSAANSVPASNGRLMAKRKLLPSPGVLLAWMLPGTALAVGLALLIAYVLTLAVAVVPLFSQN